MDLLTERDGERTCTVCGSAVEEEWEYLECGGCRAVVCSACIQRVEGRRVCPVCLGEIGPGRVHAAPITGTGEDALIPVALAHGTHPTASCLAAV
ncbi:MAG: hypothetical protein QF415_06660 [Candidatus Undinarchaeales archaeon]|nr:hypothetical protein [Candidatus Undinarchaeales archaeon]MDP7492675.1 hypothetical protein [Candidatus Undinarchaeales archaeon]